MDDESYPQPEVIREPIQLPPCDEYEYWVQQELMCAKQHAFGSNLHDGSFTVELSLPSEDIQSPHQPKVLLSKVDGHLAI